MTKKRRRAGWTLLASGLTISVTLGALWTRSQQIPIEPTTQCIAHHVVLIRTYTFQRDVDALKKWPHRAAMISDRTEVCVLERLLRWGERHSFHSCGYDTQASFWDTPREGGSRDYNVKRNCEDYGPATVLLQPLMQSYYDELHQQPTHFIYLVSLPGNRSLDIMESAMRRAGYTVLHWNTSWAHQPYLVVRAPVDRDRSTDAEEAWKRRALFEPLKRCCGLQLMDDGLPSHRTPSTTEMKNSEWFTFRMPPDADLSGAPDVLSTYGAEAEHFEPERPRQLAVVLKDPDLERVASELKGRLPFILNVKRKAAGDAPKTWSP